MIGYLFCYDLSDDDLRQRTAEVLLRYGERVQESVFELWLRSPAQFEHLQRELRALLPPLAELRWYRLTDTALAGSGALHGRGPRPPPAARLW